MSDLLTLKEVAEKLRVNRNTMHTLMLDNKLPSYKIGGVYRFKPEEVEKYIDSCRAFKPVAPTTTYPKINYKKGMKVVSV